MSTCVFYVDESGDAKRHHVPLRNGETPLFTLTGLVLPLEEWRNVDRDHLAMKRQFFGPELQRTRKRDEAYEIKGNSLTAPRNRNSRRRHIFIRELCNLIFRYGGKLFCVSVIKNPNEPVPKKSIYTMSLQYLVERFNTYISEHTYFDKGIIIADSTVEGFDRDVATSHMSFIFGHETGRLLTKIYEAPLFADSQLTVGLQIVDNLSSVIFTNHYHYYCRTVAGGFDYQHVQQHWGRIRSLEFVSVRQYENQPVYGFRVIRHDR